ncbi:MAG: hypothetical protein LQ346_002849 [Caloplaca aetnensis]|nr:MAG: hypothetical protein LQ346_002849 [Caloplaca aetnensis]
MSFAKIQDPFVRLPPTPPDFLDNADEDVNDETIRLALHVLRTERDALAHILDLYHSDRAAQRSFNHAVNAIGASSLRGGRVIVTGMGKSGKIGLKFVATLNSLAIRSAFLHPTEAMHGDLGMIGPNDLLVILSYSGRTSEIVSMLSYVDRDLPLIAVTSYKDSSSCPFFAQRPSSNCILLPAPIPCSEVQAFGVPAPTSSTTTALALTDALTLAVAHRLHPDPRLVFHQHHPGGAIGASVAQTGPQLMSGIAVTVQDVPIVISRNGGADPTILDAILTAAKSTSGWVRPSPDTIISPRQIQRLGRTSDLSQSLSSLGDEIVVEEGNWISIEAADSVQEAQSWIRSMRHTERGPSFLKSGTILGIVDAQRNKSGVVEIEDIVTEGELKS